MPKFVTLVRPPSVFSKNSYSAPVTPPLALAYLAAFVRSHGHRVAVIDGLGEDIHKVRTQEHYCIRGISDDQLLSRINPGTEIIGVSCMFSTEWVYVNDLLAKLKKQFPHALLIVGGEHVTAAAHFILTTCPYVDVCVLGEGEETLLEILNTATVVGIKIARRVRSSELANKTTAINQ